MKELVYYFDIDEKPFSLSKFIWQLIRCDSLVVITSQSLPGSKKQLEMILEKFEHRLQRSLVRPEIIPVSELTAITNINFMPVPDFSEDQLFTKLQQLESSTVEVNLYRKNVNTTANIISPVLVLNYRNENNSVNKTHSILRLNIVGQGGGKFSAVFQNNNLCEIAEGWFNRKITGTIIGNLRINTNILREILNSDNIISAVQNALIKCQLLLTKQITTDTTEHELKSIPISDSDSNSDLHKYANSWFEFAWQTNKQI
ncbi:MAG: hypothetical protein LBE18_10040 [Planctomycetaceae bacterium]|jgi:hypothetical protein|nr:hypothetical protein [Planctomycetaceae bacterium]